MKVACLGLLFSLLLMGLNPAVQASDVVWIDVRTTEEFAEGHVAEAINIPHEQIVDGVAQLNFSKDQVIYLYCGSGRRAGIAREALLELGFQNVENLGGLEDALKRQQADTETAVKD